MLVAKIAVLAGAMLGAVAAYILAGYSSTPVRAVASAIGTALLVGFAIDLAAQAGYLATPVARPLLGGFGGVFAAMIALSRVVLAPLKEKRYALAVVYSIFAFLGCGGAIFLGARLLP